MIRITAGSLELMQQGPMTAAFYLEKSVKIIDGFFGAGYSKKNPQFLVEFMKIAGQDFTSSILAGALEELAESLANFSR